MYAFYHGDRVTGAMATATTIIYTKVFFDKIFEIFCPWLSYVFVKISSYVIRNTRMFYHTPVCFTVHRKYCNEILNIVMKHRSDYNVMSIIVMKYWIYCNVTWRVYNVISMFWCQHIQYYMSILYIHRSNYDIVIEMFLLL